MRLPCKSLRKIRWLIIQYISSLHHLTFSFLAQLIPLHDSETAMQRIYFQTAILNKLEHNLKDDKVHF